LTTQALPNSFAYYNGVHINVLKFQHTNSLQKQTDFPNAMTKTSPYCDEKN